MPHGAKYGRRGHGSRCNCPDCSTTFLAHNRDKHCDCQDCTEHREIGAVAPPTTSAEDMSRANREAYERSQREQSWYVSQHVRFEADKREAAKQMSTVHMCSRKGCGAIVTRPALGLLSVQPSMEDEQKNLDLCPACMREVWELLNSAPAQGTRERGYSEPFRPDQEAGLVDTAALGEALLNLLRNNGLKSIEGTDGA